MSCPKCGGTMEGDGYTVVRHCEFAEEDEWMWKEPDAQPVYCHFGDELEEVRP